MTSGKGHGYIHASLTLSSYARETNTCGMEWQEWSGTTGMCMTGMREWVRLYWTWGALTEERRNCWYMVQRDHNDHIHEDRGSCPAMLWQGDLLEWDAMKRAGSNQTTAHSWSTALCRSSVGEKSINKWRQNLTDRKKRGSKTQKDNRGRRDCCCDGLNAGHANLMRDTSGERNHIRGSKNLTAFSSSQRSRW